MNVSTLAPFPRDPDGLPARLVCPMLNELSVVWLVSWVQGSRVVGRWFPARFLADHQARLTGGTVWRVERGQVQEAE